MKKYVCSVCGYIYDEAAGLPSSGIAPGTLWEALPPDWVCPLCGASKSEFTELSEKPAASAAVSPSRAQKAETEELQEFSPAFLSAILSNLARGCEKQYLDRESRLFGQLADYFQSRTAEATESTAASLVADIGADLADGYPLARSMAEAAGDRGALRAIVWNEKVTRMLNSLLNRYEKEGEAAFEGKRIFMCTVCGFVYVGEQPPELCPVCKVPSWKFKEIERRRSA